MSLSHTLQIYLPHAGVSGADHCQQKGGGCENIHTRPCNRIFSTFWHPTLVSPTRRGKLCRSLPTKRQTLRSRVVRFHQHMRPFKKWVFVRPERVWLRSGRRYSCVCERPLAPGIWDVSYHRRRLNVWSATSVYVTVVPVRSVTADTHTHAHAHTYTHTHTNTQTHSREDYRWRICSSTYLLAATSRINTNKKNRKKKRLRLWTWVESLTRTECVSVIKKRGEKQEKQKEKLHSTVETGASVTLQNDTPSKHLCFQICESSGVQLTVTWSGSLGPQLEIKFEIWFQIWNLISNLSLVLMENSCFFKGITSLGTSIMWRVQFKHSKQYVTWDGDGTSWFGAIQSKSLCLKSLQSSVGWYIDIRIYLWYSVFQVLLCFECMLSSTHP